MFKKHCKNHPKVHIFFIAYPHCFRISEFQHKAHAISSKHTMPNVMFQTLDEVRSQAQSGVTTRKSFHNTQQKFTEKHQCSVVAVGSHLQKKQGKVGKKDKCLSSAPGKHMRTMDRAQNKILDHALITYIFRIGHRFSS